MKEALGRIGVAVSREQEINSSPAGIDPTVQVGPFAFPANVGLIHPPGGVGGLQFPATAPVQFGSIALDPAPDSGMIRGQSALGQQFLDVAIGEGKA